MSKFAILEDEEFRNVFVIMARRKYEVIADILKMGIRGVFIEDINRKNAWYVAKRLRELLGSEVGYFKAQMPSGEAGYVFYIKPNKNGEAKTEAENGV